MPPPDSSAVLLINDMLTPGVISIWCHERERERERDFLHIAA